METNIRLFLWITNLSNSYLTTWENAKPLEHICNHLRSSSCKASCEEASVPDSSTCITVAYGLRGIISSVPILCPYTSVPTSRTLLNPSVYQVSPVLSNWTHLVLQIFLKKWVSAILFESIPKTPSARRSLGSASFMNLSPCAFYMR